MALFGYNLLINSPFLYQKRQRGHSKQKKKKIKVIHSENVKTGCFDTVGVYFQISFERYFDSMDQVAGSAGNFGRRTTCSDRTGQPHRPPCGCSKISFQPALILAAWGELATSPEAKVTAQK